MMVARTMRGDRSLFRCISAASSNRRFELHERGQLFVRTHNEPLPFAPMRVSNPDRSPVGRNRRDAGPTPTGVTEIVGDDFTLLHSITSIFITRGLNIHF
jgi:hypothetical protein